MESNVLNINTNATWATSINRAFVLGDNDLQYFYNAGKDWVGCTGDFNPKILCKAYLRATKEAIVSDAIDSIINYTNPNKKKIIKITLEMASGDKNRTFGLEFQDRELPNLISLTVGGETLSAGESVFRRTEAELHDITQWYWFLATRKWIIKIFMWLFWIYLIISVMFLGLLTITAIQNSLKTKKVTQPYKYLPKDSQESRQASKLLLEKKPEEKISHRETPFGGELKFVLNKEFWLGVCLVLGAIGLERLMFYLFPRAVFDIGKGKQRHARLRNLRKWIGGIITTIILLSFIIPYIKQKIWGNP